MYLYNPLQTNDLILGLSFIPADTRNHNCGDLARKLIISANYVEEHEEHLFLV